MGRLLDKKTVAQQKTDANVSVKLTVKPRIKPTVPSKNAIFFYGYTPDSIVSMACHEKYWVDVRILTK